MQLILVIADKLGEIKPINRRSIEKGNTACVHGSGPRVEASSGTGKHEPRDGRARSDLIGCRQPWSAAFVLAVVRAVEGLQPLFGPLIIARDWGRCGSCGPRDAFLHVLPRFSKRDRSVAMIIDTYHLSKLGL